MSDSRLLEELSGWTTWHGTALPPTPEAPECAAQAQGTGTETPTALDKPKPRNHNRNAMSGKPKEPMTVEQKQQAITMAAAGHSCNKISKAIGKDRVSIKRHLDTPEAIEQVRDERTELVELYRDRKNVV